MAKRIAALFDIDGTLIITGGAGAAAWRLAFEELYGIPADIGEFTDRTAEAVEDLDAWRSDGSADAAAAVLAGQASKEEMP